MVTDEPSSFLRSSFWDKWITIVGSVVFGIKNLMTDDNWDIIFFVEIIIAFFMYNLCISAHSMLRISYCCNINYPCTVLKAIIVLPSCLI